jgi:hypothetical protein
MKLLRIIATATTCLLPIVALSAGADKDKPAPASVKLDPKPIIERVLKNRPTKDIVLTGRLYATRRGEPTTFEILASVGKDEMRTIVRAGSSEWLMIQPVAGAARWYQKGTGELTGARRLERILNSHFTVYDLAVPYLRWPQIAYLKEDRLKGANCHVLEVRADNEPYRRVQLWVDKDSDALLRAEAYDGDDRMIKRFWITSVRKLGETWVPRGMDIAWRPPHQSMPSEERSRIEMDDGKFDARLPAEMFDEKNFGVTPPK